MMMWNLNFFSNKNFCNTMNLKWHLAQSFQTYILIKSNPSITFINRNKSMSFYTFFQISKLMILMSKKWPLRLDRLRVSLVGLFEEVLFAKNGVFKKCIMKKCFFKSWVFGKNCYKVLFEKTEGLVRTYKSSGLICKLPKKTMYI